jgi:uridine kinase
VIPPRRRPVERGSGAILIGIAGGSASGKTSIAQRIEDDLGADRVIIIKQDSYYIDLSHLPAQERATRNFDHPDAFDHELLIAQLKDLLAGRAVQQPVYDFTAHTRGAGTVTVGGHRIIVLEGILILDDPRLRELMDIKVYVDTDPDVRFIRRLRRDTHERGRSMDSVIAQYENTVRPMHLMFVEPTKRYADIIIPEGGFNVVAIDLLKTKIHSVLDTVR